MATPTSYVPIVQAEAKGLGQFLDTLSADDWQRPSACDLWAIRDVVALSRPPVKPAEAEVAAGHKRAHLDLGDQGHSSAVVRLRRRVVGAGIMRGESTANA